MKPAAFGLSDVGRCRETNEDHYSCDASLGLFTVADGMGGHAAGEVASRLAVEAVVESFRRQAPTDPGLDPDRAPQELRSAVSEANRRIVESIQSNSERRGMGTTLVILLVLEDRAFIGHVGDSRAYLLRDGRLRRLTADHSWVYDQVRAGLLSDSDAHRHPLRNIVTRALGSSPQVTTDVAEEPVRAGDVFLLCSDGLTSMLQDDEIETSLSRNGNDPESACRKLIEAANSRGGEDNTTVVVVSMGENG